uniref:NB-ARC domain-containing protein n=1 Tax=Leersia perrieri TaxID=77586 RepID=A0A0D9X5D4_9ORYZ
MMKEWENIGNSLGTPSGANPRLEGMRKILNLSYKNLPFHLRTCLMYLAKYPEDYFIQRDDVIKQWIAEGFVRSSPGQDLEDTGNSYFNELINRGLIKPEQKNYFPRVTGCRVHDMMLDLILSKCQEDNFITVDYNCEDYISMATQHGYNCNKVRRLSLQFKAAKSACRMLTEGREIPDHLAQVRSVSLFGKHASGLPLLLQFKYLRVLHIMWNDGSDRADLTSLSQLLHLRYLMFVGRSCKVELPSRICGLVNLETLEIECSSIVSVPLDIVSLPSLYHLMLQPKWPLNRLPIIKSLRTLDISPSMGMDIKALGELTNLRELKLYFAKKMMLTVGSLGTLWSSIGKLQNLRYLRIIGISGIADEDLLDSLWSFPRSLEIVILRDCGFPRVPRWINSLSNLTLLYMFVSETCTDEVGVLGELPSLISLKLYVYGQIKGTIMFGASGGSFPALEFLFLSCDGDASAQLGFKEGVLPKLERLQLMLYNCLLPPIGMEHLLSLQLIELEGKSKTYPWDAAECALRNAAQAHPNRPALKFHRV